LKTLVIRTVLSLLATLALMTGSAKAQAPAGFDFGKAEIKINKLSDNFYSLESIGGTMGVLTGPDGVFMVDADYVQFGQKVAETVKKISPMPVRFLVNTHLHGDHTGGDAAFAMMGTTVFSRDELRYRLAHPVAGATGAVPPAATGAALPMVTYRGPVTFHIDGEEVDLIPIYRAHTDGDTMIYFRNNDILMTGDFFRSVGYPNMDRNNGGSLNGLLDGLGIAIGMCGPKTKVIPGHGAMVDRTAIVAQRDLTLVMRHRVAAMIKQGMTQEQVIAAHPTADYDAKVEQAQTTSERFLTQLYGELKAAQ
jgi:glyoxylase-like metal-dependent hydrolase (beta-lactamase superfamily II)